MNGKINKYYLNRNFENCIGNYFNEKEKFSIRSIYRVR